VFVSANSHPAYVWRAFQLGAAGFVDKRAIVADLPFAIEAALDRRTFVSPTLLAELPTGYSSSGKLSGVIDSLRCERSRGDVCHPLPIAGITPKVRKKGVESAAVVSAPSSLSHLFHGDQRKLSDLGGAIVCRSALRPRGVAR
jgi:hypothetical protein